MKEFCWNIPKFTTKPFDGIAVSFKLSGFDYMFFNPGFELISVTRFNSWLNFVSLQTGSEINIIYRMIIEKLKWSCLFKLLLLLFIKQKKISNFKKEYFYKKYIYYFFAGKISIFRFFLYLNLWMCCETWHTMGFNLKLKFVRINNRINKKLVFRKRSKVFQFSPVRFRICKYANDCANLIEIKILFCAFWEKALKTSFLIRIQGFRVVKCICLMFL